MQSCGTLSDSLVLFQALSWYYTGSTQSAGLHANSLGLQRCHPERVFGIMQLQALEASADRGLCKTPTQWNG